MTCVYKEYKVNIEMVQEQWLQPKTKFLLCYNMKIVAGEVSYMKNMYVR